MQMDKNKLDRFALKFILRFAKIQVYLWSTANYKHSAGISKVSVVILKQLASAMEHHILDTNAEKQLS
jgi:hypothetical protein